MTGRPPADLRLVAHDPRLSLNEVDVLALVAATPGAHLDLDNIGFPLITYTAGTPRITLNGLYLRSNLPKPAVFEAVARLEEFGYLPDGGIR